jgi:hypothetical protein
MKNLGMILILLSALSFLLAIIAAFSGRIIDVQPEGFSRACTNLALIAIALGVWLKNEGNAP